jgi:epsilon-lactone hydrolase
MSVEQRETLDRMLRQSQLDAGGDVREQRRRFEEMVAQPLPAGVTVTPAALGSVPTVEITVAGVEPRHIVLYFHGGVYALGTAALGADLASEIGRRIDAAVISVEYRLAPEHPYPAAVDDAVAAYDVLLQRGVAPQDIVVAGESAGAGLAIAGLVAARDRGLPMPAAALLMSPWTDLTLSGTSMDTKQGIDPQLARELFRPRVADYVGDHDPSEGLISPIFADLSGLPPLVIQAGSHEVLLDDAVRLARRAAADDVGVTLDITPGVPHVFQAFHAVLEEGASALDRAARLLSDLLQGSEPTGGTEREQRIDAPAHR